MIILATNLIDIRQDNDPTNWLNMIVIMNVEILVNDIRGMTQRLIDSCAITFDMSSCIGNMSCNTSKHSQKFI